VDKLWKRQRVITAAARRFTGKDNLSDWRS